MKYSFDNKVRVIFLEKLNLRKWPEVEVKLKSCAVGGNRGIKSMVWGVISSHFQSITWTVAHPPLTSQVRSETTRQLTLR